MLDKVPIHYRIAAYLGCIEIGLGGVFHSLRLPCTGYVLSLHQIFCLNRAISDMHSLFAPIKISLAAGFLSLSQGVVLFADAFPFLIISEESLDDLNSRLESPVPMTRFRPNIVIKGVNAYDEDNFTKLRIGNVVFSAVKKCSRCTVTTVDQETGMQGKEPLRTLSRYRNSEKGIMFGMNLIHNASGVIRIGDSVELLK